MSSSVIKRVDARLLILPLETPFVIASGSKHRIENVVIEVELEDGTIGYGESSPLEPINGESARTVLAVAEEMAPTLVGRDARDLEELSGLMTAVFGVQAAARAGIELALFDAVSRHANTSPWAMFGASTETLETDYTISICDAEVARDRATELVQAGFRLLKIKLSGNHTTDISRIAATREGAPKAQLQLDANEGYDADGARRLLDDLAARDLLPDLLEQPLPRHDLAGMRKVRQHGSVPVAADESVFTLVDAQRVAESEAVDVINIKLMKSGLVEGRRIHRFCRENDIGLMIGCMLESRLGMNPSVQFAAGLGHFSFIDLDPHAHASEPFTGGATLEGPRWTLDPEVKGWGLSPV